MKRVFDRAAGVGVVMLGLFVAVRLVGCSVEKAPVPAVFSDDLTLDAAMQQSASTGLPVLAVATADWCGPCQAYKRGALADERVAGVIRRRTIPVYVNIDEDPDAAQRLGVSSIPATYLIADGQVVGSFNGNRSADALIGWLENHTGR